MKTAVLGCIVVTLHLAASAQVGKIRLLEGELPAITDSVRYVDALNRLAMLLYEQDPDSTAWYAYKAREIATRIGYRQGEADATNNMGVTADVTGDNQTALRYYNDAYIQYSALNDSALRVETLMNIAMVYTGLGKSEKAIEHFKLAFSLGDKLTHDSIVSLLIYNYILQYPDRFTPAQTDAYIQRAVSIATRYNDARLLLAIRQLKANTLIGKGQRDSGIALLQQTAALGEKQGLLYMSLDILVGLGDLLAESDSTRAVDYYKQALAITEDKKFNSYAQDITQKLFDFYSAKKDTAHAFYYGQKVVHVFQKKQDNDRKQGLDYIDYALKDQQFKIVKQRSDYNAKLLWLVCAACAMAIAIIIILWRNAGRNRQTHLLLQKQYASLESARESLEKSNQEYARLLKVVAHDLRNPIGAINSASTTILATKKNDPVLVKLIDEASSRCLRLIGELLETDFEISPESLHKELIPVSEILQNAVQLLTFMTKEKKQSLELKPPSPIVLYVDREQMTRVIENLIVNAVKFSPAGATVYVAAEDRQDHVTITVRDEGIGIPASMSKKLFDPFTSAKRKGTAGEQTFGLGLYICKQIVEAHGGQIGFESEEKKGSTFFIRLQK